MSWLGCRCSIIAGVISQNASYSEHLRSSRRSDSWQYNTDLTMKLNDGQWLLTLSIDEVTLGSTILT